MKKLIASIAAAALSTSACAQMPLPLVDNKAPATQPAQAPAVPANVDKLTLIPLLGDLVAAMPRKAADNCPATARFKLQTTDVVGIQWALIMSTIKWEQGFAGKGQPICSATLRGEQMPIQPKPGLRFFASVQVNNDNGRSSDSVELRSSCSGGSCLLLPPGQAKTATSPTDKISQQAAALQSQLGKLWAATGGKLTQQDEECDATQQTCQTAPGTVGENIKTK